MIMSYDKPYEKMDFMFDRTFINEYGNNLERYSQDYGYEDLAEGDLRANYMRNMLILRLKAIVLMMFI